MMVGLTVASASAMAAEQGQGTVTFKGSIIAAPCSISQDTANQTVDLGSVSSKVLKSKGVSAPRQFHIKLEGCELDTEKTVTAAFNGIADGDNLKMQGGTAAGATINIQDYTGVPVKINNVTGSTPLAISNGENIMHFSAYLAAPKDSATEVRTGSFNSVASFVLAYQ